MAKKKPSKVSKAPNAASKRDQKKLKQPGSTRKPRAASSPNIREHLDAGKIIQTAARTAEADATCFGEYAADLPGMNVAANGHLPERFWEWARWSDRVLARMYHSSMRPDADSSPSLPLLTMRFVFDPCRPQAKDFRCFRWKRTAKFWRVREYNSAEAARITPDLYQHQLLVKHPSRLAVLDCTLGGARDLSRLRSIIVRWLGKSPDPPSDLPDPLDAPPLLSERERAVLDLISSQPESGRITGKEILRQLKEHSSILLGQSDLTKNIIPKLQQYGIRNQRPDGYYLLDDHR